MLSTFQQPNFVLRRQVLALTGKFRIYAPDGRLAFYSQQKMFRLKEDIRVYTDESMQQEVLYIQARQIIDFAAAYDVIDSTSRELVGTWRRKGLRSMVRDEWELLDRSGRPAGTLQEDNMTMALLRRFIFGKWMPQNYDVLMQNRRVADLRQRFNLLRYELDLDFSMDQQGLFDHRLGIAGAILLATIEGRQE